MPCGKAFGKILRSTIKQYGKKKGMKIAWSIYKKMRK
jgi:hypothetical protein